MTYVSSKVVPLNVLYHSVYKCILSVTVPYIGTVVFGGGQIVNPRDWVESRNVILLFHNRNQLFMILRFWETEESGLRDSETVLWG